MNDERFPLSITLKSEARTVKMVHNVSSPALMFGFLVPSPDGDRLKGYKQFFDFPEESRCAETEFPEALLPQMVKCLEDFGFEVDTGLRVLSE